MFAEIFNGGGGREEEGFDADDVGGPDHGLDVECGPAIRCHADELGLMSITGWMEIESETYLDFFGDSAQVDV